MVGPRSESPPHVLARRDANGAVEAVDAAEAVDAVDATGGTKVVGEEKGEEKEATMRELVNPSGIVHGDTPGHALPYSSSIRNALTRREFAPAIRVVCGRGGGGAGDAASGTTTGPSEQSEVEEPGRGMKSGKGKHKITSAPFQWRQQSRGDAMYSRQLEQNTRRTMLQVTHAPGCRTSPVTFLRAHPEVFLVRSMLTKIEPGSLLRKTGVESSGGRAVYVSWPAKSPSPAHKCPHPKRARGSEVQNAAPCLCKGTGQGCCFLLFLGVAGGLVLDFRAQRERGKRGRRRSEVKRKTRREALAAVP
ncbi:hypothetical protein C8R46DRAFT_1032891 [Mycena filopes]|nr:hypothetical protein C8R46DRAFT_1032891 [Mycena filopes]